MSGETSDMWLKQSILAQGKSEQGSVLVEAAFIFTLLTILSCAALDYGFWLMTRSKAERINYSLASVIRERVNLYDGRETLTSSDVSQLAELARFMAGDNSVKTLCVQVESLSFKEVTTRRQVDQYQKMTAGAAKCSTSASALTRYAELSPMSIRGRWVPLYQVTLSVPAPAGSLSGLLSAVGALPETITVSNIVLAR
ncbi:MULTISPECIES: tight adherence pilus pseudopilin TadF [Tatumella]|uniref:Tight adherence pilus pseudopilin TadF n=3 Tax=Tatumella TaxID=82986 RepID=A0ABW1VPQ1_9GAMM|nr:MULTISPECIES: tight adherence pilus pseudopilin TadF [unclassified Tatumella]MBS0855871.1 hypothetical protein [Tatumella sp. JGM16]MBS0877004.1 hypothetical protein [Tatumella sp. JGM82]MBS0890859.1 hypothetical protein [Tatumella sp. JGM94]MBS0912832.1 hypothetical protein [Tatumella sp. JGM91]